jgi:hypothetical protein
MSQTPVTRLSSLEIYNPDYQGPQDRALSHLPRLIAPHVTLAQANLLPDLKDGAFFYATDLQTFFFRQEGTWVPLNPMIPAYNDAGHLVGYLPKVPSLTTEQINSIEAPAAGWLVYDGTTNALKLRTNAAWIALAAAE